MGCEGWRGLALDVERWVKGGKRWHKNSYPPGVFVVVMDGETFRPIYTTLCGREFPRMAKTDMVARGEMCGTCAKMEQQASSLKG